MRQIPTTVDPQDLSAALAAELAPMVYGRVWDTVDAPNRTVLLDGARTMIERLMPMIAAARAQSTLFRTGRFTLHSGSVSDFKIDCDALTDDDIETLAWMIASWTRFREVEGVPSGGLRIAAALQRYRSGNPHDPLLIVDDVLSTGASMDDHRGDRPAVGVVLFARDQWRCPEWVRPMFSGPLLYDEFALDPGTHG